MNITMEDIAKAIQQANRHWNGCLRCGNRADNGFHCAVDGNDFDFCSIGCIAKYSKEKGCRVTILECLNDGTRVCELGKACDGCPYFYRSKKPKVKVMLI